GNMIPEVAPGGTDPPDKALHYTTAVAYDDLDRPVSKFLAPRTLSPADVALFAADHELTTWDYGVVGHTGNYKGRLTYWKAFAPTGNFLLLRNNQYDAQGNPGGFT